MHKSEFNFDMVMCFIQIAVECSFLEICPHEVLFIHFSQNQLLAGNDLSTMVGRDRNSGSTADFNSFSKYQNRSGVKIWFKERFLAYTLYFSPDFL